MMDGCGVARRWARTGVMFVALSAIGGAAQAGIPGYQLVGTYQLPTGAAAFDALPDGRLMVMVGDSIVVQSAPNASGYAPAGSVPSGLIGSFGAAFLSVSPNGQTIAIGDNQAGSGVQSVLLLESSSLSTSGPTAPVLVGAPNYHAHWADDSTLYVTGVADFVSPGVVTRVDVPTITSATAWTVVTGINGASAGVVTDGTHLYTANGYTFPSGSGSQTGHVRAFSLLSLPASGAGAPVNFETAGVLVADVLSGSPLGLDPLGNLLAGGGDFDDGDNGYAAVVSAGAIASALSGGAPATGADGQMLSPAGAQFYGAMFNRGTDELLVWSFGSPTVHRYAIPTPGAAGALLGALTLATLRRRR